MTTIEEFFINEYERVVEENKELKSELDKIKSNREFGITDLGEPVNLVEVKTSTQDYFWNNTGLSKNQLEKLLNLPNESFIEQMKQVRRTDYDWSSDYALCIRKERYRYSIEVKDLDGEKQYAFDDTQYEKLVSLQFDELDTGDWYEEKYLPEIKKRLLYKNYVKPLKNVLKRSSEKKVNNQTRSSIHKAHSKP